MALLFNPFRKRKMFARADMRHDCQIDGEIVLTEKMVSYEGRLINFSRGGAMFRPRLAYLMSRRGDAVQVQTAGIVLAGEIVATTPFGFGVRFETPLSEAALAHLLALSSAGTADQTAAA
ncbi:MAG: PilZ domain-containing protein [Novosphingobium sp.]|nr:PilZ domain-containing protein [Novosphingobium sp.]